MEGDFYVEYGRLDDRQRAIIQNLFYRNEVVGGSAGTGKSLIALHKLARVPQDKTAALVVFTKSLKKYFEDGMRVLQIPDTTVHYKQEWGMWQRVDYLFVDECQDFTADEIKGFTECCDKVFFFGDTGQTIMEFGDEVKQTVEDTAKMVGVPVEYLYVNYRLTKENAALAEAVGRRNDLVRYCQRNGTKPRLISGATFDEQLGTIIETIRTNNLTRACILVPYNTEARAIASPNNDRKLSVDYVGSYFASHGMPVELKKNSNLGDVMTLDFNSSVPKVLSWHSVKGLQFNDVFIPFCETGYDEVMKKALYVAITRAYNRLYIGFTGLPNPDIFPSQESGIYAETESIEVI